MIAAVGIFTLGAVLFIVLPGDAGLIGIAFMATAGAAVLATLKTRRR